MVTKINVKSPQVDNSYTYQSSMFLELAKVPKGVSGGLEYLTENIQLNSFFQSRVSRTRDLDENFKSPREVFTTLMIVDLLAGSKLSNSIQPLLIPFVKKFMKDDLTHFFENHDLLPPDIDCISYATKYLHSVGEIESDILNKVCGALLENRNSEGIFRVYIDPTKQRMKIDHAVCANALSLFYYSGVFLEEIRSTEEYLFDILTTGEYRLGSRYYESPDLFLYFLTRALSFNPKAFKVFKRHIQAALEERKNTTTYPLDLAMRVIVSKWLGVDNSIEEEILKDMQGFEGNWPDDAFFTAGKTKVYFGGKFISTAFAVKALSENPPLFN